MESGSKSQVLVRQNFRENDVKEKIFVKMISRKNFNYSTKISFWFWLQNVVPKRLGFRVYFRNHFLGFVSCSDSAKIVGFFGFLIASLPQTKIVLEVFVKALGKNQKKIPFLCKTTERRGLVLYIPYFLFTSITIFSTEILSMYL